MIRIKVVPTFKCKLVAYCWQILCPKSNDLKSFAHNLQNN